MMTNHPDPIPATNQAGEVGRDDLYRMIDGFSDFLTFDADQRMKMRSRVRTFCAMAEATQPATSQEGEAVEKAREHVLSGDYRMAYFAMCEAYGKLAATPTPPTLSDDTDDDSPAARLQFARTCFAAIITGEPASARAIARAGLDFCDLTAAQRSRMRGDA